MKRTPFAKSLALGVGLLALPAAGAAEDVRPTDAPFLWKIAGDSPSYLYGTIHLPDDRVLALPASVEKALGQADVLYTEIPFDDETTRKGMAAFLMPEGETLTKVLPAPVKARLDAFLAPRGMSSAMFDPVTPMAVSVQIALLDYAAQMATKLPQDAMLVERAEAAGKSTAALETIDEQVDAFRAFSLEEGIRMLEMTLEMLEELDGKSAGGMLVDAYLTGSEDVLMQAMHDSMDPDDPVTKRFEAVLIDARNVIMSDRIDEILRKGAAQSHFFAVGTAHYFGETGILAQLKADGYEVTRVKSAAEVPAAVVAP